MTSQALSATNPAPRRAAICTSLSETRPFLLTSAAAIAAVIAYMAAFQPNLSLRVSLPLALAALLLSNPLRFRFPPGTTPAVALAFLTFASGLWAADEGLYTTATLASFAGVGTFVILAGIRWRRWHVMLLLGGLVAGSARGYLRLEAEAADMSLIEGERIGAAGDLNANYLSYAIIASLVAILMLPMGASFSRRLVTLSLKVGAFICAAAALKLTDTRGALISLVALAAWTIVCSALRPRVHWAYGMAAVAYLAILASLSGALDKFFESIDFGERGGNDLSGRLDLWPAARTMISENPFLGVGAGNFRLYNDLGLTTHHSVMEIAVTLGAVGLIALTAFLVRITASLGSKRPQWVGALHIGFLVAYIAPVFTSSTWILTMGFWVSSAVVIAVSIGFSSPPKRRGRQES